MTLQELDTALKAVCPETYELAAPAGATRAVVWNCYGASHLLADDCTALDVPKVQIDVFFQDLADGIVEAVKDALRALFLPYEVIEDSYDDEYALRRCIIQLVVY